MQKVVLYMVSIVSIVMFSGCAAMFSGGSQVITVRSEPEDAEVLLNGMPIGTTPLTYNAKKGKNQIISVQKEGYKRVDMPMNTTFDATTLLGVFLYSLPVTTDLLSGTAYEFMPNYYNIELRKKDVQ